LPRLSSRFTARGAVGSRLHHDPVDNVVLLAVENVEVRGKKISSLGTTLIE
jgi:hypothetical protein